MSDESKDEPAAPAKPKKAKRGETPLPPDPFGGPRFEDEAYDPGEPFRYVPPNNLMS